MDLTTFSPSSALLTVILLALAPFAAVMVTSFTKIVVVLSLLRNALGLQQVPPNLVINALAMVLTIYVMYPVGREVMTVLDENPVVIESSADLLRVADTAKEPVREFLLEHTDALEQRFFHNTIERIQNKDDAEPVAPTDFIVLVPAFTISELTEAFQIGFLIFLPFIVIDLVIANILMAMGMLMLSPTIISLPFKLLLFVVVEGWAKLAHGLVLTYL
ncbi:MAG: EscR/YscR/HrcR family type III secretion system export apparatus protein [Gammaproteobacteria bacterium]|nr:MAG: EscR/YscR/HrcR family type III secretion system export apparatus protein [Gammaproteobacteria bacterium]